MTAISVSTRLRFRFWLAVGALALALGSALPVRNAAGAQDASAFVAGVGTQGLEALGPGVSSPERLARFRVLLQQDFDLSGIGLFALGRYRSSVTPQEQQEFFRLYPDFTIQAFSFRLNGYGGVTGSRVVGTETVVNSKIVRGDGNGVALDWYLTDTGGQYRITDLAVGGVSMKLALRDQFASWIANNGGRFAALLAVLRQQTAR